MTTRTARRYYAYSPDMGRVRIPPEFNEEEAITWAAGRGAHNVVLEDGPASRPTKIAFVWKHDEAEKANVLRNALWDALSGQFPTATVRQIGEAHKTITKLIKEAQS